MQSRSTPTQSWWRFAVAAIAICTSCGSDRTDDSTTTIFPSKSTTTSSPLSTSTTASTTVTTSTSDAATTTTTTTTTTSTTASTPSCTSKETSTSPPDVLATLQVVKVCPAINGDIAIVDGNHGATCMYDATTTGPVELTLQRSLLVNGLRIAFSGNAPAGSTMTITLSDQQPQDIPIKATLAPYGFTPFPLGQSGTVDRVTVTPPVGICHITIGT